MRNRALKAAAAAISARLQELDARVGHIAQRIEESAAAHQHDLRRTLDVLQMVHDDEAANRLRLYELRRSADYELAFSETDPLVTVIIPTHTRAGMLRERSIPSALAQTHPHIEVVVVGDASPTEVDEAIASLGEERVRFFNLPTRGPYPDDEDHAWLAYGTPAYNLAVTEARGRWIAPLSDDDAFLPDHVERLLAAARTDRLELVYGRLRENLPDGTTRLIGAFPPRQGEFGMQGALLHSGLRFMHMHLTDVLFDLPNDIALCRRMLRIGVRMGMIDAVVSDYFPSYDWGQRHTLRASSPDADRPAPAHEEPIPTMAELQSHAAALESQLAAMRDSKSWRWTAPLRHATRWARQLGLRPGR
jgi:glycosyltransferase involved in cell wall biosynthesis